MINTPDKFFVFLGLLFSLLVALAAAGTTYMLVYEDPDRRYKRNEVIKSAVIMFVLLATITFGLAYGVHKFVK